MAQSLTPDGTRLTLAEQGETGNFDIVALTVGEPRTIEPFLATEYAENGGEVSPDGNWLAYRSDETGQREVWVRSFPDANRRRIKISVRVARHLCGGTMVVSCFFEVLEAACSPYPSS